MQKLPKFSIRAKLIIAFVGLSILPMVLVSIYGLYANVQTMERMALQDLLHDVSTIRARTANFMTGIEGDVSVLLNSAPVERWGRFYGRGNTSEDTIVLRQIAEEFLAIARTKRIFYQLRLVSSEQDELLRIQCDDIIDSASHCNIVAADKLQHGGGAYYALLTRALGHDQITFHPVELAFQNSRRIPVISFVAPIFRGTHQTGLLIANVFAGALFRELQTQRSRDIGESVVLVGGDGHYLYDSRERNDWNRVIASREEDNLQKDYPPEIAQRILSGAEGISSDRTDAIIAYSPLIPSQLPPASSAAGFTSSLFVFETVPRANLTRDARSAAQTYAWLLLAFLGSAVGLGLLATTQFTRPISVVRQGAEVISRGNYKHRLAVESGDEIEELAGQFNRMAASLEEHEHEIQLHRYRLEEIVAHRTQELLEEKGKLQAILDNVPSAFVMLDSRGRIQTASAAFTSITGLLLADVRGQESNVAFHAAHLCQHRPEEGETLSTDVKSHVDQITDLNGSARFLEHVTIPILEKGRVASILEIITDVTKRKRLEDQLVQSGKLMATGEMAAIIAHGFRNSLTSIKMILQLQQEAKRMGAESRKSLRVALDSIYRMETVVQELLNFARPAPFEFRMADLNTLVKESLALVEARMKQNGVTLTRRFDARIPPLLLDAPHVRESLVNIILNAIQAIEAGSMVSRRPRISVMTRKIFLARSMRDLQSPIRPEDEARASESREILLRKGLACVVVSVSDNGPGIERSTLKRVFDPFFTTKTNGTGLGLPMVKRTINAHGGLVSIRSIRGKGATVEIVLPLRQGGASESARTPPAKGPKV
ncbi:MAG TPA: ATP-binding protein [Bacteroidota bacterium]|nr:ATP-binding protein [Bacteroidota bacterium]